MEPKFEVPHSGINHNSSAGEAKSTNRLAEATDFAVWEKMTSAARFLTLSRSTHATLTYFHWQIFDWLGNQATSLWTSSPGASWSLTAQVGSEIPLPVGASSWADWNDHVTARSGDLTRQEVEGKDDAGILACSATGFDGIVVLNLLVKTPQFCDPVCANFVETAACMLAAQLLAEKSTRHDPLRARFFGKPLTERQQRIRELMNTEMTYAQIAHRLGFSESTVRQEAMRIFDKLGVSNRLAVRLLPEASE